MGRGAVVVALERVAVAEAGEVRVVGHVVRAGAVVAVELDRVGGDGRGRRGARSNVHGSSSRVRTPRQGAGYRLGRHDLDR